MSKSKVPSPDFGPPSNARVPVITIDGPGGAGKGTIGRLLAQRLGYTLLESGALYRALALAAKQEQVGLNDFASLIDLARDLDVTFAADSRGYPSIRFRQPPGLVAEGRDMGTVVFSDADLKIFLTASAHERARRRHKQLMEQGVNANLGQLAKDLAARDERDASRASAPLLPAPDAVIVDTAGRGIDEVFASVFRLANVVQPI
jgi:cytidylate kinase